MQTDMLNKPLEIGDYVFVTRKNYRDLVVSRVIGFTPKQIRVVYQASWSSTSSETYLTGQVIKIAPEDLVNLPAYEQKRKEALDQFFEKEKAAKAG